MPHVVNWQVGENDFGRSLHIDIGLNNGRRYILCLTRGMGTGDLAREFHRLQHFMLEAARPDPRSMLDPRGDPRRYDPDLRIRSMRREDFYNYDTLDDAMRTQVHRGVREREPEEPAEPPFLGEGESYE